MIDFQGLYEAVHTTEVIKGPQLVVYIEVFKQRIPAVRLLDLLGIPSPSAINTHVKRFGVKVNEMFSLISHPQIPIKYLGAEPRCRRTYEEEINEVKRRLA